MNIWQSICLGLGIVVLAVLWLRAIMFSHGYDLTYLIVVSIMTVAVTTGFVFTCRNIGKK